MPSLIAAIQDPVPALEVDARTVLRSAPEPVVTEPEPATAEVLAPFEAAVAVRPTRSYAQLTVQRSGDEHYVLIGQHSDDSIVLRAGEPRGRPHLSLGELASGRRVGGADLRPEDLYRLMLVWSREEPELVDWLQRLRTAVGDDQLRLVIWDTTGFDIPWELFHVPGGGAPS